MSNKFEMMLQEIQSLQIRDIIHWKTEGVWKDKYMIYQKLNGEVGLIDIYKGIENKTSF